MQDTFYINLLTDLRLKNGLSYQLGNSYRCVGLVSLLALMLL